jgi:putative ABC transport system substrate-binding protein
MLGKGGIRRRTLLLAALAAQVMPLRSLAQPKVARVGFLSLRARARADAPDPYFEAFLRGMRELGYVEGKNLSIEWRYADGRNDRLPALAQELVKAKPDIIVSHSTAGTLALKRATSTIPIVFTSLTDPVGMGIVASLARPGGNITGLTLRADDVSPKLVELTQTLLPKATRIGVLVNPGTPFHPAVLNMVRTAAERRGMSVASAEASNAGEMERGMTKLARDGANAVFLLSDSIYSQERRLASATALKLRVPTIAVDRIHVQAGTLLSYGTDTSESYRRAAGYVDRILKGAKPADLPLVEPTNFLLSINLKTAKAMGIQVPRDLLARADEVIQ